MRLALLLVLAAGCTPSLTARAAAPPAGHVHRWWHAERDVGIAGIARDTGGELVPGATIVVAPAGTTGHEQIVITDDAGAYRLAIAPGDYVVTAYYGDATLEATAVSVRAGGTSHVDFTFDPDANRGEVIQLEAG